MLSQRAHALTAHVAWVLDDGDASVATSTHVDMLNDATRNEAYARAIARKAPSASLALDVGTGTGLLAALVANFNRDIRVAACEYHPRLAETAKDVLQGLNRVDVHHMRSSDATPEALFGDKTKRAELLVSEIFDSGVLGEGVIASVRDAKRRLLTADAQILPARVRVVGAPATCPALRALATGAQPANLSTSSTTTTTAAGVVALHWPRVASRFGGRMLAKPEVLCELDFEANERSGRVSCCHVLDEGTDGETGQATSFVLSNYEDESIDVMIVWFEIDFNGDGAVLYTTKPMTEDELANADADADAEMRLSSSHGDERRVWADHWKHELFILPQSVGKTTNGTIKVVTAHTDDALRIGVATGGDDVVAPPVDVPRISLDDVHAKLQPSPLSSPLFSDAYGSLPWRHALRWWYEASRPDAVKPSCKSAHICACLISAPALARSRRPISTGVVPGFSETGMVDLSVSNPLIVGESPVVLPFPLWQAPSAEPVSAVGIAMSLVPSSRIYHACNFDGGSSSSSSSNDDDDDNDDIAILGEGCVTLTALRPAHGVALWVEWEQPSSDPPSMWPLERQAFLPLLEVSSRKPGAQVDVKLRVRASDGTVDVRVHDASS